MLNGKGVERAGGRYVAVPDMRETYLAAVTKGIKLSRPIKVIAACGNGTAGAFAPEALRRIGAEVIGMDTELDFTFPKYNPNPEDMEMLHAMGDAVKEQGADLCLGFDGDGDRCGVVDDTGPRNLRRQDRRACWRATCRRTHKNAQFVVDVKSTGLYLTDPVLKATRRQDRLLEDRPQLYQAPHRRAEGAGGLRKVGPLLLQSAHRPWL